MKRKRDDDVLEFLIKNDPTLSAIISEYPDCLLLEDKPSEVGPFEFLCQTIISQQLNIKTAETILNRFKKKRKLKAEYILSLSDEDFKATGISGRKMDYLRCLSSEFQTENLNSEKLQKMSDEEIHETLIKIKGIGKWTVDMFLIFHLKRLNVFPSGDFGVRKGLSILKGSKLSEKQCIEYAEKWDPYKSVGSWYMWKIKDKK